MNSIIYIAGKPARIHRTRQQHSADGDVLSTFEVRTAVPTSLKVVTSNLHARSHISCHCAHDCCGHYFGGLRGRVIPTRKNGRNYRFQTLYSRNL